MNCLYCFLRSGVCVWNWFLIWEECCSYVGYLMKPSTMTGFCYGFLLTTCYTLLDPPVAPDFFSPVPGWVWSSAQHKSARDPTPQRPERNWVGRRWSRRCAFIIVSLLTLWAKRSAGKVGRGMTLLPGVSYHCGQGCFFVLRYTRSMCFGGRLQNPL